MVFGWLCIFFLLHAYQAKADQNVTYDDSSSSIAYFGQWSNSAQNSLDFGGSHHLSNDPNGTATFTFTGIAVYVLAPKWPYQVGMSMTLDGGDPLVVDLQDLTIPTSTDGGPEDKAWSVVADANGLNNTRHRLVISMPSGYLYQIVDGFIVTVPNSVSGASSSTTSTISISRVPISTGTVATPIATSIHTSLIAIGSSPTSTSSSASQSSTTTSTSHTLSTVHLTIITVCAAGGGLLLLGLLMSCLWICCRRRRQRTRKVDDSMGIADPSSGLDDGDQNVESLGDPQIQQMAQRSEVVPVAVSSVASSKSSIRSGLGSLRRGLARQFSLLSNPASITSARTDPTFQGTYDPWSSNYQRRIVPPNSSFPARGLSGPLHPAYSATGTAASDNGKDSASPNQPPRAAFGKPPSEAPYEATIIEEEEGVDEVLPEEGQSASSRTSGESHDRRHPRSPPRARVSSHSNRRLRSPQDDESDDDRYERDRYDRHRYDRDRYGRDRYDRDRYDRYGRRIYPDSRSSGRPSSSSARRTHSREDSYYRGSDDAGRSRGDYSPRRYEDSRRRRR